MNVCLKARVPASDDTSMGGDSRCRLAMGLPVELNKSMSELLRKFRTGFMGALLGGTAFWLPIVALEWISVSLVNPLLCTLLPLATLLICYAMLMRRWNTGNRPRLAVCMTMGLYFFAPIFMEMGATAADGGFHQYHSWSDAAYLLLSSIFPPATLMLSAYHATVFGVILATAVLLLIYFRLERPIKLGEEHLPI